MNHSITVDVRDLPEAPGFVRKVTIHGDGSGPQGAAVTIEFASAAEYVSGDFEGGGLRYMADFADRDDAVRALEQFLQRPVDQWRNFDERPHEPVVIVEAPFTPENVAYFESLVRDRKLALPPSATWTVGGMYWEHVALWGEYRPDRIGEETALRLRARGIADDDE